MQGLESFVAELHAHLTTDPNACVEKGVDARRGDLPDPSLRYADGQAARARSLLGTLGELRRHDATFEEALDLDLAELLLRADAYRLSHAFGGVRALARTPTAGRDIGNGIFLLLAQDARPAPERLTDITSRITRIPEYLETLLARLDEPVARWVRMDVERVRGLPSLFDSIVGLAKDHGADTQSLEGAIFEARRALDAYEARLLALPTTSELHIGPEQAAEVVALRGIEQSPETLHRWATEFLAETAASVEELRGRLAPALGLPKSATAEEVQQRLARRHRLRVEDGDFRVVLDRYEAELARIVEFVRERDLFPIPEGQRVQILRTPEFMVPSIPAGAMMSPPPFRTGERLSLVYLTLSEALLDEHTEISIPSMVIHEAIPGHHLQLSEAARHPSVIRRHFEAMDQAEGWTTMLEDYMLDAGYAADHADEVRFVEKREIGRIGARVAIDLFFMTGDRGYLEVGVPCNLNDPDPFRAAASLLAAVTGFVPERVDAELGWYSQERGYPLSYLTGNRLVWQLRRDVSAHLGAGIETDRRFHRAFLAAGSMPVSRLRSLMQHQGLLPARP